MLKLEALALELLEYRIEAIHERREVRGGLAGTWELANSLKRSVSSMAGSERKRFEAANRRLRHLAENPQSARETTKRFEDLVLGSAAPAKQGSSPGSAEITGRGPADSRTPATESLHDPRLTVEQIALQRLARRVWWYELDRFVLQLAVSLRVERDRFTARLLYATHRNIQRYASQRDYHSDANLSRFRVVEPLPRRDDPLVSVDDLDSVAELIREILATILNLGQDGTPLAGLELPRRNALDYIRRIALVVATDPHAGSFTSTPAVKPGSAELRIAIQELDKEWLAQNERVQQRRQLEVRLQEAQALERSQRELFKRDVTSFRALLNSFFEKISRFLPRSVGGQASSPKLQGGVLFGVNPLLRVESVPVDTLHLTVNIKGPTRFHFGGQEISLSGAGADRIIHLQDQQAPLKSALTLPLSRGVLALFSEADYLHLKLEDHERSLAVRVAEALATFFVLSHEKRTEMLTLFRVLANTVSGEPQEVVRVGLQRIRELSARAPDLRAAVEGFIRGSARAAQIELSEPALLALVRRFQTVLTIQPEDLTALLERLPGAEATVYPLTDEPLNIKAEGQNLTVRQYRSRAKGALDSFVVMLPGRTVGSFSEYLIEHVGSGTLICVRGDGELAVLFFREKLEADTLLA